MKKFLLDALKSFGFVLVYYVGDRVCRLVIGKDEFPVYYWIGAGLVLVYQIMKDLAEIKNKIEENKNEKKYLIL